MDTARRDSRLRHPIANAGARRELVADRAEDAQVWDTAAHLYVDGVHAPLPAATRA